MIFTELLTELKRNEMTLACDFLRRLHHVRQLVFGHCQVDSDCQVDSECASR
jgi:hypothetical protein